jgi:serine/threonine protein kinase
LIGEHEPPYQDLVKQGLNSFQILRKTCMTGLRPPIPDKMPEPIKEIITTCWSENPDQRPSAKGNPPPPFPGRLWLTLPPLLLLLWPDLWKKIVDLRKEYRKAPQSWFVAKADHQQQDDEDEDDENSAELVSPRGSMGSHRNAVERNRSGDAEEGSIVLDVSSPRRTPRGGAYGSLKKGQWQASAKDDKESEAKFLSEVEKRVEERLKQQEETMRSELMQQFKRQSVMTDKEKVLAEIDPKQVVKHFSVGKGYITNTIPPLLRFLSFLSASSLFSSCCQQVLTWRTATLQSVRRGVQGSAAR